MHLLGSGTLSSPEFVSISRVLDTSQMDPSMSKLASHGEPLLLASPISTISPSMTLLALQELNEYITSVSNVTHNRHSKASSADRLMVELLEEDQRLMDRVQIFRPLCAQGIGLHYRLVTSTNHQQRGAAWALSNLSALLSAYSKSKAPANSKERKIETPVAGILICVGMSGRPFAHSSSSLQYGISQRIEDCLGLLQSIGVSDVPAVQSLMSTLLITEDEYRKGNEIADAASITAIPESSEQALGKFANEQRVGAPIMGQVLKSTTNQVLMSTKRLTTATVNIATLGLLNRGLSGEVSLHIALNSSSADLARVMVERMRVLSVSENDTILSKYETSGTQRKANLDLTGTKKKRNKLKSKKTFIADLEMFDYEGPKKSKKQRYRAALKSNAKNSGDLSDAASSTMDGESVISKLSGGGTKSSGLLRKPNEASSIMSRRSSTSGGSKNVPTLMAPQRDYMASRRSSGSHGPKWEDGPSSRSLQTDDGKEKKPGRRATGDFAGNWNSTGSDGTPTTEEMSTEASRSFSLGYENSGGVPSAPAAVIPAPPTNRRIHVNIALNEDLSCSYKNSRMISCSVEGVIQVQVKSTSRVGIPYHLLLRDASSHIQSLQENKKFAEDIPVGDKTNGIDHRFAVSVPRGDNYFPLLRYKCSPDLRPVPIRVQTRVKTDSGFCRVALQISSNPHNEGSLTDLTIIMGVAEDILGETLITQPSGGVWNAAKRSVIWCVSELGDGEKFQLQARFEINPNSNIAEPPKFPVLVRCQCMYAQLSDVEVEVCESDSHPAEVTMKTARRFRLSHQERS